MKKTGAGEQVGDDTYSAGVPPVPVQVSAEGRTRHEVARLLLEQGPMTAVTVAEQLGISPTAIRRHLDALLADGEAETRDAPRRGPRGRGRPAKLFLLTEAGRARFGHAYDDLAVSAIRFLAEHAGEDAVRAFAERRVASLVEPHRKAITGEDDPAARAEALATALTREGYAASTRQVGVGEQLCQHHCPVAHVAAEFPQLCEAETEAFARLLGTHVQRLATIARGDNACTTHVPAATAGSPAPQAPGSTERPEAAPPPSGRKARIPNGGKPA
ncbi:helix-turn-helix transcriptional regulator [Amycolatopsis sp. NPDC059021]|uniref:helix-turn-helix transcriptional regulator n=1 Tax=Amycolatopsis sp. NPDC059021 TaxID=3346704 RepID=UPI00366B3276